MRNTQIEPLLFPVELRPILFPTSSSGDLFNAKRGTRIPSHQAVVDVERGRALGVVGRDYRLLPNAEAFELAKRAFARYFPSADPADFEVYDVVAPQTRSYCHVDFIHRGYRVDRWEQDTWLPYLRVTNSYNGSRALRLELGFVREACSNGMIFTKESVEVRVHHTRRALGRLSEVPITESVDRLRALEAEFVGYLTRIRASPVPRLYAVPIVAKALGLTFRPAPLAEPATDGAEGRKADRERERLVEFKRAAQALVRRYYDEMGPSAYAVFNAATDYASHRADPKECVRVAALQVRVGQWLRDYAAAASRPGFDLDTYVGDDLALFETV